MSDFLDNLTLRSLGEPDHVVQPRLASHFEPSGAETEISLFDAPEIHPIDGEFVPDREPPRRNKPRRLVESVPSTDPVVDEILIPPALPQPIPTEFAAPEARPKPVKPPIELEQAPVFQAPPPTLPTIHLPIIQPHRDGGPFVEERPTQTYSEINRDENLQPARSVPLEPERPESTLTGLEPRRVVEPLPRREPVPRSMPDAVGLSLPERTAISTDEQPPTIQVTIGRIEVRAAPAGKQRQASNESHTKLGKDLATYLRERSGGKP